MADKYEEKVGAFLKWHYAKTGRFDQRPITTDSPFPSRPSFFEALTILSTMVSVVRQVPLLAGDISLDTSDAKRPWGMGRVWSEYENACLIHEMSNVQSNHGCWDHSINRSLLSYLSHVLNVKYGIDRSSGSVKNQWYRELRARSGIDERGNFGSTAAKNSRYGSSMRVSVVELKTARTKSKGKLTYVPSNSKSASGRSSHGKNKRKTVLKLNLKPKEDDGSV
jgi:hypothetical protein